MVRMQHTDVGRTLFVPILGDCKVLAHFRDSGGKLKQVVQFKDGEGKVHRGKGIIIPAPIWPLGYFKRHR